MVQITQTESGGIVLAPSYELIQNSGWLLSSYFVPHVGEVWYRYIIFREIEKNSYSVLMETKCNNVVKTFMVDRSTNYPDSKMRECMNKNNLPYWHFAYQLAKYWESQLKIDFSRFTEYLASSLLDKNTPDLIYRENFFTEELFGFKVRDINMYQQLHDALWAFQPAGSSNVIILHVWDKI